METSDQECLKAHDVLSAISDQALSRNTINSCYDLITTIAGQESEHFRELGIDTDILYQREVELGSKALIYSYTDRLLCVVYYLETIDRYIYRGFTLNEVEEALTSYLSKY